MVGTGVFPTCSHKSNLCFSLSLFRYHHISHNKINSADQSKSSLTGKAGLVDSSDSHMRLKEMSHTDLFLTMCLRPKVDAEVIIRGRVPMARALCCLLRDGERFTMGDPGAWYSQGAAHLPDTDRIALRGKESLETGLRLGKGEESTHQCQCLPWAACSWDLRTVLSWDGAVHGDRGELGMPLPACRRGFVPCGLGHATL